MSNSSVPYDEFDSFVESSDSFLAGRENNFRAKDDEKVIDEDSTSVDSNNDASVSVKRKSKVNGFTYIIAGSLLGGGIFYASAPGSISSSDQQFVKDSSAAVSVALTEADRWYNEYGTYTGFIPSVEVLFASGGPYFLTAAGSGDDCSYSGIVPNQIVEIKRDPTGEKCRPELMAELAAALSGL